MFAARRGRPYVAGAPDYWELTVTTDTASQSFSVNIAAGTSPDITIVWGDDLSDTYTSIGIKSHTYVDIGTYTVRISGSFSAANGNIRLATSLVKSVGVIGGIVNLGSFERLLRDSTRITSLPTDFIRYYPAITNLSNFIRNCSGITALPKDIFRYSTGAVSFLEAFRGSGLTSLPDDLFLYNENAVSMSNAFRECSNLATLCPDLFRSTVNCANYVSVFTNCNKLSLRSDMWFRSGEESTRFLNQSVGFSSAMQIGTFTGTQGTAPALWECDFGTGTPIKTSCFTGHTTSSISNHADVVADGTWGLA